MLTSTMVPVLSFTPGLRLCVELAKAHLVQLILLQNMRSWQTVVSSGATSRPDRCRRVHQCTTHIKFDTPVTLPASLPGDSPSSADDLLNEAATRQIGSRPADNSSTRLIRGVSTGGRLDEQVTASEVRGPVSQAR